MKTLRVNTDKTTTQIKIENLEAWKLRLKSMHPDHPEFLERQLAKVDKEIEELKKPT